MRQLLRAMLVAAILVDSARAQSAPAVPRPIQDNSFLLEEAYNQEAGVVQHINTVMFDRTIRTWFYSLTDEWPVNGQRHQLSLTIPLQNAPAGGSAALGDIALNYRLQAIGSGDTRLAVTPRVTVLFPTAAEELGGGTLAFQGALASSYVATSRLVLHTNVGLTLEPNADDGLGGNGGLVDVNVGQSAILLVHSKFNLMLEGTVTSFEEFTTTGVRVRGTGITIAPGMRWAHDFASGLQIVPGIAFPIGLRANSGQRGVFLYLSFEHDMPGLRK